MRNSWTAMLLVLAAVAVSGGCSESHANKAGGQRGQKPLVLTMANEDGGEEVAGFAKQVARLSGGSIRIELRPNWLLHEVDYENGLIRDVQAGKADLGWAGARAWDSLGVNSLGALTAPLLIDSFLLQQRVVQSPLAQRMLRTLDGVGLVGLGILPGPMRRPLSRSHPLVVPPDFAGLTIGVQQSRVAAETMRALGANPVWFGSSDPVVAFDGIESQVASVFGNRYDRVDKVMTANVNLWPRPLVLFANRKAYDALTPKQQRLLRQAAAAAIPGETDATRALEQTDARALCRSGLRFVSASPAELAALRRAVQPVYDTLERDPATRAAIAAIERLKHQSAAAPQTLPACRSDAQKVAGGSTAIDGVYTVTTTAADDRAAGWPLDLIVPENYGKQVVVFDRGRFASTQEDKEACTWAYGTFVVTRDRLEQTFTGGGGISPNNALNKPGELMTFGWSLYRGNLKLTHVTHGFVGENPPAPPKPFSQISATPSSQFLSKRCQPPKQALPR